MAAAFHCLYFLPVSCSTEQPLNRVPTGQRSEITHNKFFALLRRRGPERWLKDRAIKMSRKRERTESGREKKKKSKVPPHWRKQRGYNHFKTEEIEATLLGAKQRWRGRRRPDPRGIALLDLEVERPDLGLWDTKTALSSLLPLHSLTTGNDAPPLDHDLTLTGATEENSQRRR